MANTDGSNNKYRVHVKGFEAVILYPALVTPGLVPMGGCMSVILATKKDFHEKIHEKDPTREGSKIGCITARKLHSHLVLVGWGNAAVFDTQAIPYNAHKRQLIAKQHMIYTSHVKAAKEYTHKNYAGWYLGELKEKDFLVEGYDEFGKAKKWGVLHEAATKMYTKEGYKHLFQLNFKAFDISMQPGMYELAYVYFELPDDAHPTRNSKPCGTEGHTVEEQSDGSRQCGTPCSYTVPGDDVVNEYFYNDNLAQKPKLLREPAKIEANKIVGGHKMFHLYDAIKKIKEVKRPNGTTYHCSFDFTSISDTAFLQARHPVYIPKQWEGKIGVMGDLHVSSRQMLYPLANAQVIPGVDPKNSPYLGEIAHQNIHSASRLMTEISAQSDMLAIVGDLYDHTRNCDPLYFVDEIKKTSQLWNAMSYDKNYKGNYDAYPRAIDGLLLLSRILALYQDKEKPVVYVSGNHEAYEHPYGTSPRAGVGNIDITRTNEGVAADHNLTFYEASLLHGKESYNMGMELKLASSHFVYASASAGIAPASPPPMVQFNFREENYDWLYCLYSPWKDCVITYGTGDEGYNFICLGWGNEEHFMMSTLVRQGGSLPRAGEPCTKDQLALTAWAVEQSSARQNILLTHFTFVCYDQMIPMSTTKAAVDTGASVLLSRYDIGSFYENRKKMYEYLRQGKVRYSISGHSHRAGAYAYLGSPSLTGDVSVRGSVGDTRELHLAQPKGTYRSLVCGAAGPYSYQNIEGELGGFGMDRPQGLILNVPKDTVAWKKDEAAAKPRLAVVMDYLWYAGKNPPFSGRYEDRDFNGLYRINDKLYFFLSEKFKRVFKGSHPFDTVTLFSHGDLGNATLCMKAGDTVTLREFMLPSGPEKRSVPMFALDPPTPTSLKQFIQQRKEFYSYANFLSITFRNVPGVVDAEHYDLGSPWCFPVLVSHGCRDVFRPPSRTGGEVPDHDHYAEKWESEYGA